MSRIVKVAVPVPLRRLFDFDVGDQFPKVGARVWVPFGRRRLLGVVMAHSETSDVPDSKRKPIAGIVDQQPLLDAGYLRMLNWLAEYYHHPIGDVVATALPKRLRHGDAAEVPQDLWVTSGGLAKRLGSRQQLLWDRVQKAGPLARQQLVFSAADAAALKRMLTQGILRETAPPPHRYQTPGEGPQLNAEQQQAVDVVAAQRKQFAPYVLHGITGSGKTEVYLRMLEPIIRQGAQALILVPEIGLTPQLLARFERLNARMVCLHSAVSDQVRMHAWLKAQTGEADIVIGTRSAVFTPFKALGMIIIDEEHDHSLKQMDGLRYHARDLAVWRAAQASIPIVMGSATPSIESWHNINRNRYRLLRLEKRARGKPPRFQLVDVRTRNLESGLTSEAVSTIREKLEAGEQVLVFLNRRGYAPVLVCHQCGWHADCAHCDARMVWHRSQQQLRCHHCGAFERVPTQCPVCGAEALVAAGAGTERLEEYLDEVLAPFPVLRVDTDSMRRKGAFDALLTKVKAGDPCVMVGTQMLAKGHDLPQVTLVVVVNIDAALNSPDFRGSERCAQTVLQVAGRAGRGDVAGSCMILTHHPNHRLWPQLFQSGYVDFAQETLAERAAAQMPPLQFMAVIRADTRSATQGMHWLDRCAARVGHQPDVECLGPLPAVMQRKAGWYRQSVTLLSPQRQSLHRALSVWEQVLSQSKPPPQGRWAIDVDPVFLE